VNNYIFTQGENMATVLITGTSRGIGLEFTKQYAEDGWQVIACCRAPERSLALQSLAKAHANIRLIALDVANFAQIDAVALALKDTPIDVLINNAGVYPESSLNDADFQDWSAAFKINSMAPFKMTQAFLPHLVNGNQKKVATLTSKMGSIDDNTSGGSYIYRTSKVAVNMVMKSLSIDLAQYKIAVAILHPGWVITDMGGPNGLIDAKTSVTGLRQQIAQLSLENSGIFTAYNGQPIAW
jgi:NAD(P)-dependent dehydrogenase (short-subunit alcohol dehydrogenase family)